MPRQSAGSRRRFWLSSAASMVAGIAAASWPQASAAPATPTERVAAQQAVSLLYVWDATIVQDSRRTNELISYARSRRFNTLALEASPLGYLEPYAESNYRRFVEQAHRAGIRVLALSGYGWFTVSAEAALPGQPTSHEEGFALYKNIVESQIFDGILDDSSPYETSYVREDGSSGNYFWDKTEQAAQDYLNWLQGLHKIADGLPHYQAVPLWFDQDARLAKLLLNGETSGHSLSWYVAQHADVLNVLAYRDQASEIFSSVSGELELGRVLIGVESQQQEIGLEHTTFYEEGIKALGRELTNVWRQTRNNPNFAGFSLHDYRGAVTLESRQRQQRNRRR